MVGGGVRLGGEKRGSEARDNGQSISAIWSLGKYWMEGMEQGKGILQLSKVILRFTY